MIHYSCDRCRRVIDPEMDLRYTVRVEVSASMDSFDAKGDDDRDELLEIHEILERMEDNFCRCGAHVRIIEAIETAAAEMRKGVRS